MSSSRAEDGVGNDGKAVVPNSPARLKVGKGQCGECSDVSSGLNNFDSWMPIVELLEELELGPLDVSRSSKMQFVWGLIALGVSLVLVVSVVAMMIVHSGVPAYPFMLSGAVVLFLSGAVLCLFGSDASQFRWINIKLQTLSSSLIKLFQSVLALHLWAVCGLMTFFIVYPDEVPSREIYISGMLALTLAVGCLCAILWNRPIPLRIVELRAGIGVQGFSAGYEVTVLAAFSAIAIVGLSRFSLGWESVACALLLGLIGYWAYRWRKIDAAGSAVIQALEKVRNAARRVNRAECLSTKSESYGELLDSYRELQVHLLSGTKHVRQRVVSFGLLTLCAIADARRNVGGVASEIVYGAERIAAAQKILDMTDERFAHGSAQVFDGIERMMSSDFYPYMSKNSLKKSRKGSVRSDLYHYLRFWSLRF